MSPSKTEPTEPSESPRHDGHPEPFTWGGLAGIGGASAAVSVVSGTLSTAFEWQYPAWLPLALAFLVVVAADASIRSAARTSELKNPMRWVLWVLNACLVFMTAVGGTRLVTPARAGDETPKEVRRSARETEDTASPQGPPSVVSARPSETPVPSEPETPPEPHVRPTPTVRPSVSRPLEPVPSGEAEPVAPQEPEHRVEPAPRPVRTARPTLARPEEAADEQAEEPVKGRETSGFRRLGDISLF